MTVTERFATSRYYCLIPVHARGGLTVTLKLSMLSMSADNNAILYINDDPIKAPAAIVDAVVAAVVPHATALIAYSAGTAPPAVITTAAAVATTIKPPIAQ